MTKKDQLRAALAGAAEAASDGQELVGRLLTPAEWDQVAGGDGHSQGGNFTQTSGSFGQTGGGSHSQTGGGGYSMHYTREEE